MRTIYFKTCSFYCSNGKYTSFNGDINLFLHYSVLFSAITVKVAVHSVVACNSAVFSIIYRNGRKKPIRGCMALALCSF